MNSILVAVVTLTVALSTLVTAQYDGRCYVNVCGVGGEIPLGSALVPPGYRVLETAPESVCYGYPATGITTTVCVSDLTPIVQCDGWNSVIVTRRGSLMAPATVFMSVTCGYPNDWIPPLGFKSTQESAVPTAKKLE